ncbi:MAG TPA: MarR family winged helix-turn-helix transcriptional regulator [Stellaceae bacterium]|jgi:DNA-binding MarR family transcriptional regulator|nr:MarR family winged helix-turn-helix transcriptional regulator [Stellaceae bacterium]
MKLNPSTNFAEPEAEPGLELERFLPYRLSVLTNRISTAIARVYVRRFALTVPEWRVMAVLGRFGPLSANAVCERTAMDKVRVSRAVARLAAAGRLERRTDDADRRRALLELTARGRAVYDEIGPLALAVETRLLAQLSAVDHADLDRLLPKLEAAAATSFAEG